MKAVAAKESPESGRIARLSFCIGCALAVAVAAQEPAAPEESKNEARVVLSASELARDPEATGRPVDTVSEEPPEPAAIVAPEPVLDDSSCELPPLVLLTLDPATQRAVVRVGDAPPRIVKKGSKLDRTEAVVRLVGRDKLVADGPPDAAGKRPALWIHAAEKPGQSSRVQCFLPRASGAASTAGPDERSDP